MEILSKLIPKKNCTFRLEENTLKEMYCIITDMKKSNTCGFDGLNANIIKEIPHMTSIMMTHAINCMIRTGVFPNILKISRLLPLSKPGKNKQELNSYRPIANLHILEKLTEEFLKRKMIKYIEENSILLENHHGGIVNHSTLTAKSLVDYFTGRGIDRDNLTVVLSTDLSTAYDSVDHGILLKKLEYYGFKNKEHKLIESYLSDRTHYIELQNKRSKVSTDLKCSVIQGSKLSGLLYIIYVNEVPLLHELLNNKEICKEWTKKEVKEFDTIVHETICFVDDNNSIIEFSNPKDAN